MAEPTEPKKETVHITLPPRHTATGADDDRDTERLDLPTGPETSQERSPSATPAPPPATPPLAHSPLPPPPNRAVVPPRRIVPPPPMPAVTPKAPVMPAPPPRTASVPPPPLVAKAPPPPVAPISAPVPPPTLQPKKETSRIDTAPAPKKETSRINLVPDQPAKTARMSKTQPLVTVTATPVPPPLAPMKVALDDDAPTSIISSIPTSLCWALVLISAAILIIEIWTYIS